MKPPIHQKNQKINRRLHVLTHQNIMFQQIMKGMRLTLSLDDLLKIVINSIRKGMGFKRCGIFLVEPGARQLKLALGIDRHGKFERGASSFSLLPHRGHNDQSDLIYGFKKYILSNDVMGRYKEGITDHITIHNMAVMPIYAGPGRPIGNLAVDNLDHYRRITLTDMSFLADYATLVGLAIESVRNQEKTVALSLTDPLTGLSNRLFFDKTLAHEIRRCQRYQRSFSLAIADVDHFKKINDSYGHVVGDEVLRYIAELFKDNIRNLDMVSRIGGDEFAILLPETPPNDISGFVRRIFATVRQSKSALATFSGVNARVTISLGVVTYRGGATTARQLLKLADKSLYQAKNAGRDRCGPIKVFRV